MSERSTFLASSHILSYGTLLGLQTYQTFVGGIIAFKTLPRPQFSTLQSAIFPVYFGLQTALPFVLAITYPGERTIANSVPKGVVGLLAEDNRVTTLLPILATFLSGLTNSLILRPATARVKRQREHQEIVDKKKYTDAPPHSEKMARLNKSFARLHGISSLVNIVGLAATVYYGTVLAKRLD
ncbi:hypothetical protein FQN57_001735 [Myotisia sp. PD_48]|nr:hypothetical protein FQN57_001735 [Myotisia sp. PD_48]